MAATEAAVPFDPREREVSKVWFAIILGFLMFPLAIGAGKATNEIAGRFYPEKSRYLVGEPVYIIFEVVNNSSNDVVASIPSGHLSGGATYAVASAKHAGFGVDGCCDWPGTDVGDSVTVKLAPGQRYSERFILNYWYHLDKPGTYQAHLVHDVQFKSIAPGVSVRDAVVSTGHWHQISISSEFAITLAKGNREALKPIFERVAKDLKSKDPGRVGQAQWAIVHLAPVSFEPLIKKLALIGPNSAPERSGWLVDGVDGLARLNTPSARRTLAYLAEHKGRGDAAVALAKTGDRSYLPLLIRLVRDRVLGESPAAAVGIMGGKDALRFLVSQLHSKNFIDRQNAAWGLSFTGDGEAVRPLVEALYDPNMYVRRTALEALGRLTHRAPRSVDFRECGMLPWPQSNPFEDPWPPWQAWWKANADRVTVYRWNDCGRALPLVSKKRNSE